MFAVKPLAGYRRVSHVGGRADDSFHSPSDQAEEIEAWARPRKLKVAMLEPELDAKGSDADRPIFRRAVEGVKAGEFSGVVVAYLSRAGRDLRLMLDLWAEVEAAGGNVFFARENIDASTPSGRLQRNLIASIAQHELEERREGFDRARRGAVEAGIWQRRQTPRGYRRAANRGLEPGERAGEVRALFADYLAGTPISQLAARVGMTSGGVRALLRNRVYLGELRVGKYVNERGHEPVVDATTFEAVQVELASRTRPARTFDGPALLAGLVRCASCGHVMTRSGGIQAKGGPAYSCPTRHSREHCPTPAAIATRRIDPFVEEIAVAELAKLRITVQAGDTVARAQAALDLAKRDRDGFLAALDGAGVDVEAVRREAATRQRAVDQAEETLRRESARAPILPQIRGGIETWSQLNAHERNRLLRHLLAAVIVRPAGRGRRPPVSSRVRVIAAGIDLGLPSSAPERGNGIVPIWFDSDADGVLGVSSGEDRAQALGG